MFAKLEEKKKAIILRKKGFSYTEIIKEVAVSKSSLSLWLSKYPLTKFQKERFNNVSFTNTKLSELRQHKQNEYHGQLRITVTKSTDLNRKINDWINGVCLRSGVV